MNVEKIIEPNIEFNDFESELYKKAEVSIGLAKDLILAKIPNEELLGIFVKGSYVQQELVADSDVDIVVILKTATYLPQVYELTKDPSNPVEIPFQIGAYTINELQTGKEENPRPKKPSPISVINKQLGHFIFIYGEKLSNEDLFKRTDLKDLTGLMSAFRSTFIPQYLEGKFSFKELIKQVIWLAEREQWNLGFKTEYNWRKLIASIESKDSNHLAITAYKYRTAYRMKNASSITSDDKETFLKRLLEYLEVLENRHIK